MVTKESVKDMLKYGERLTLECKKASNEVPKSVWETYSSFANTVGGDILLGVQENMEEEDSEKRFSIIGVTNANKIKKDFWNTLNSDKVNRNLLKDEDVQSFEIDNHTVVCIHVPEASYLDKPVFINGNLLKGSFKRNYEGDYHCHDDEVKEMLRDANEAGNDGMLIENYTMDDVDLATLAAYRQRFRIANADHVWNDIDDKEFLKMLGGYVVDRSTRKEGLTMAGLLMFGKGAPIRERFDNLRMDYIDKTNIVGNSRWSDRLTYDGRWENNLYNFFIIVSRKLTFDLKRPFRLEGMSRDDEPPTYKAIREALTNLIIHSDLMITGILKVVKEDQSFLFSNPGSLKIPVSDIYEGGNSKARNPRLQKMFRMIGFGDNAGSGFPTILNVWKDENWRKPVIYELPDLRQVELRLWMVSLLPKESSDALQKLFGNKYTVLPSDEQIILCTAYLEKSVNNTRLQTLLDKNVLEVAKMLTHLVTEKMLQKKPNGRWTTYEVNVSSFSPQNEHDAKDVGKDVGKELIALIMADEKITAIVAAEKLGLSSRQTERLFSELKKSGKIARVGGRKMGHWEVR